MTPNEFKAWFDGFTEAFEGRIPTKAQWGRIKDRVAEIDGKPVTERHYIDRYWPTYVKTYPAYNPLGGWVTTTYCGGTSATATGTLTNVSTTTAQAFNSTKATLELGRAEAKEIA